MNLKFSALLIFTIACLFQLPQVNSYVMGIDLGTEWFKVALAKQKFEIVLNEQTARKTATAVALQRGDLIIGTDAKNLISKIPKTTYVYPTQILGRSIDDPIVQGSLPYLYFPLESNEQGLQIPYDENVTFVPEDITALLLTFAKEIATKTATFTVRDAVITVPPYLTQRQRQAILDAAKLAGISVLALLNENTAAGIHFGIERTFTENDTYVVFYDMGGSSLTTSLVSFKSFPDPNSKKNGTVEQLTVEQVAWDPLLGGREFDYRLATHFAKKVLKEIGEDITPTSNPRAFAKLMKAAQKGKEVLSANKETGVSVESLIGDYDFSTSITREEFESLCSDLFNRALDPVKQLLTRANLKISDISNFEVIGGGIRVPKLQQTLLEFLGRTELDKHINGDEAIVMGATFYAATKSPTFRVKEFKVKDIIPFGVQATLKSPSGELEKNTELFQAGSRMNSKKTLTFSVSESFTVDITYDKSDLLPVGTDPLIVSYTVSGLPTLESHNITGTPKVSASFRLNQHGMFVLEDAEAEYTVISYQPRAIVPETENTPEEVITVDDTEDSADGEEKGEEKSEEKDEDTEKTADTEDETANEKEEPETVADEPEFEMVPVTRIHRSKLQIVATRVFGMTKEQFKESDSRLKEIQGRTELKKEKEQDKNSLEAYTYEMRDKLQTEEVLEVTNEEQRQEFSELLSKAAEWLYDEGADTTSSEYRSKLRELKVLGDKIFNRISEKSERPLAAMRLRVYIDSLKRSLENITQKLEVTEEERDKVLDSFVDTEKWLDEKFDAQNALKPYEDPVLTSFDIGMRQKMLDTQSRNLLKRPKKKIPKIVVESNSTATNSTIEIEVPENVAQGEEETETVEEKVIDEGAKVEEEVPKDEL